jgi:hypothetical protein
MDPIEGIGVVEHAESAIAVAAAQAVARLRRKRFCMELSLEALKLGSCRNWYPAEWVKSTAGAEKSRVLAYIRGRMSR